MDAAEVSRAIIELFKNVETTEVSDNTFFFYDSERHFPFATLVVNYVYNPVPNLGASPFRYNHRFLPSSGRPPIIL